jgi:hypothetical protein
MLPRQQGVDDEASYHECGCGCSLLYASGSARANSVTITVVAGQVRATPPSITGTVGITFNTVPPSLINDLRVNPPKLESDPVKITVTVRIDPLVEVTPPRITGNAPRADFANGSVTIDGGNLTVTPGSVRLTPEGERLLKEAAKKGEMELIKAKKQTEKAKGAAQQAIDKGKADAEQSIGRLNSDVRTKATQVKEEWNRMLQDVAARIKAKQDELARLLKK